MDQPAIYIPVEDPALGYATKALGLQYTRPSPAVTHVLLPVPSFDSRGRIRGGKDLEAVLAALPETVTVIGGNLRHPALTNYKTLDLLQDPCYVTENAAITAHCALAEIVTRLPVTLAGQKILVIAWGRIGKCLARLLRNLDAQVTVSARKEADLALAKALGYVAVNITELSPALPQFRVLVNTAPAPVLTEEQLSLCREDVLKIELASTRGIPGPHVVQALGLPGKLAPESSGKLIAATLMRLLNGKEAES